MRQRSLVVSIHAIFIVFCLFFSSCGYRWGAGSWNAEYSTISVPYVQNDPNGDLTAALVHELTTTGTFIYCNQGGRLTLCATLLDITEENIGYRYEPKNAKRKSHSENIDDDDNEKESHYYEKKQKIKRSTIPTETRLRAIVEITLIDRCNNTCILGPVRVAGFVDFDHDYYESPNAVNVFSLGQLTDVEQAREAALSPLYHNLARNIVEYLRWGWE